MNFDVKIYQERRKFIDQRILDDKKKRKKKKIHLTRKIWIKKTFWGIFCIRQIAKWFLSFPRSRNWNLYDEIGKKKRKTSDVCRQLRWQWILLAPRARNCQVRREKSESFDRCQWTGQRRIHRRISEKDRREGGWAGRERERRGTNSSFAPASVYYMEAHGDFAFRQRDLVKLILFHELRTTPTPRKFYLKW